MSQRMNRLGLRAITTVFCVVVTCFGVEAAFGLDEALLGKADNEVKNAEYDLEAARGSAGTAANPAKGSRAKLTTMRLDSAQKRLDQAAAILNELPADDAAVTAVRGRYDAAVAGVAQVRAILNPGAPPKEDKPAESAPTDDQESNEAEQAPAAPSAPRLDYKQEELLKNARWYVRETTGYTNAVSAIVARIDAEGPKPVHSEIRDGLATVETAKKKHALAADYIAQLPEGHPQVQPVADQVTEGGALIGALTSRLQAVDVELAKITGMEHYPNYDADFKLMQELSGRYRNFGFTVQQPEKLAQVVKEDGQVLAEITRIAKTYLPLVEQKTEAGEQMERVFNHFQSSRNQFAAELVEYKNGLPAAFEADLKEAMDLADQGVAEQKPMYFGENSGIEQRFGWAETKLLVLKAFGEQEAKPYVDRLEEVRAQIRERAKSLEAKIIAENTLPPDRFTGSDRSEIVEYATRAWAEQQPDAEVLTSRIPSEAWTRDTRWEWSNGAFYKIDASKVQVQLIVKHDDKLAAIRPVNLYKNHLKGDTVNAYPMDEIGEELQPRRYLMLEKVK